MTTFVRRRGEVARATHDDRGMSLIELLSAITITPMIVGAIATSLIAVMNLESQPSSSINASGGAEIAASYFTPDIQSAVNLTTDATLLSSSTTMCATAGTPVLGLSTSAVRDTTITYVEVDGARSSSLYREVCTSTGSVVSSHLVSSNVPSGLHANVSPVGVATNADAGWVNLTTAAVTGVEMDLSIGGGQYALSATPQTSAYAGQAASAFAPAFPFEVLDTSCPSLSTSGGGEISVGGGAGYLGVSATCSGAVSLGGSATLNANVGTANASYATNSSVSVSSNATFTGTQQYVSGGGSNPFATLARPSIPSSYGVAAGTCTTTGCTSGSYSSSISISKTSGTFTFDPSTGPTPNLVIFKYPVSISGSSTSVAFDGGSGVTYVFEQGLSVSGGTVDFGPATYIFRANPSTGAAISVSSTIGASGGLLMYAASGTISIAGQSSTSLSGTSAYDEIALWQGSCDPVTLSGGSQTLTIGGVYAPKATVNLTGNGNLSLQFLIAKDVTKSGSGAITIAPAS